MPTTDPDAWLRTCGDPRGPGYVFRRGIALTTELARALVRPGCRWLDIGCGTGQLLEALLSADACAIGIDLAPRMIELARRRVAAPPPLAIARAEGLPFGAGTLDGITATSFMGCVPDAGPVFGEIRRVLKPHGHAVITFTSGDSWLLRLNYAVGPRNGDSYHLYSIRQVVAALEEIGFEILGLRFYGFVLTVGRWTFPPAAVARRLECDGPSWLANHLARNFVLVIRKGVR